MNSRQRILRAMRKQSVDYPPLWLRFWPLGEQDNIPIPWRDQVERCKQLTQLGIDDVLMLEPPLGYVENYNADQVHGVSSMVLEIPPQDSDSDPILEKSYTTHAGLLHQVIKKSVDWPHGLDIPLFSDFNISRYVKPIIQKPEDLDALRALLGEPTPEQIQEFRKRAAALHQKAGQLEVAIEGGMTALGDSAMWLLGMEQTLTLQMDDPGFIEALLDILLEWELKRTGFLLEEGIDLLTHMAWYEGTDFWTPRNFRRLLKPRLKQLVESAHARHIPFRYIITKGWGPIAEDLLEIGVDCLSGVDPVQDGIDLREVLVKYGSRMCLMGGVNSAVSLCLWDEEEIRQAVRQAMDIFAGSTGFILYPVDAIFSNCDWEKVLILIDEWKKCTKC